MAAVIKIVQLATGEKSPADGQYMVTFDHEAHFGRGEITTQPDPQYALRFADKGAAFEFWSRQSRYRPIRPDGKENKPFTAYTVVIEEVP